MKRFRPASRRFFSTASSPAPASDVPTPPQPPLYHPRRNLRVFILPDNTPFLRSYLHMRRITHHRLLHDKHTPQHSRTADERDTDCLLVSQPTSVYTMGRAAKLRHVRLTTTPVDSTTIEQATALLNNTQHTTHSHSHSPATPPLLLRVDRGGETTWHGPGQLLAYPLINLTHTRCDLHHYLRSLESATARALHSLPLTHTIPIVSDPHYTGVWRAGRKVAAIGVGCSRWHTTHGIALNVDVDKRHYDDITPCGIEEAGRTVGNVRDEWEGEGRVWGEASGGSSGSSGSGSGSGTGIGGSVVCGYGDVREAVVRELGVVFGMQCVLESESVDSVLQRWDEAELKRGGSTSLSATAAAAAAAGLQSTVRAVSTPSSALANASV